MPLPTAADPVAARSSFLCAYMSNHPDTLTAYVCNARLPPDAGKKPPVLSAKMTAIDSHGMTLSYATRGSDSLSEIRIPFDPPLLGYEEVKPRLLAMKLDAEEALGMTSPIEVWSFGLPPDLYITLFLESFLILTTFFPDVAGPIRALHDIFGMRFLKCVWAFMIAVHSVEALFVASLCRKHVPFGHFAAWWTLGTLFFGFPFLVSLRKRIQAARIELMNKVL